MCNQGQKLAGVEDGGLYVYNNLVKHICAAKPFLLQHSFFESAAGFQRLYDTCKRANHPLLIGGDHSIASSSVMASN
jgi:arginase family enzyme